MVLNHFIFCIHLLCCYSPWRALAFFKIPPHFLYLLLILQSLCFHSSQSSFHFIQSMSFWSSCNFFLLRRIVCQHLHSSAIFHYFQCPIHYTQLFNLRFCWELHTSSTFVIILSILIHTILYSLLSSIDYQFIVRL